MTSFKRTTTTKTLYVNDFMSRYKSRMNSDINEIIINNLSFKEDLLNHLKTHTGSRSAKGTIDKKFGCNQCDKKFFTRKDLKRHR